MTNKVKTQKKFKRIRKSTPKKTHKKYRKHHGGAPNNQPSMSQPFNNQQSISQPQINPMTPTPMSQPFNSQQSMNQPSINQNQSGINQMTPMTPMSQPFNSQQSMSQPQMNPTMPMNQPQMNPTMPMNQPQMNSPVSMNQPQMNSTMPMNQPQMNSTMPMNQPQTNSTMPMNQPQMNSPVSMNQMTPIPENSGMNMDQLNSIENPISNGINNINNVGINNILEGTFNKPVDEEESRIEKNIGKDTSGLIVSLAPVNAVKESEMEKKLNKNYPTPGFSEYEGLPDDKTAPKLLVHGIYPTYLYSSKPHENNNM
jgi:hypothetical protein